MIVLLLLLVTVKLSFVGGIFECLDDQANRRFNKLRDCRRSAGPILSFVNYRSLERCLGYASQRNALAVNFSPPEASKFRDGKFQFTCQLLACPEINENNLVNDSAYDYYSFYRNLSSNATCIKSIGIFKLYTEKLNYTDATENCIRDGGSLAQVVTETRTNALSTLISNSMTTWSKMAYVGLDDIFTSKGIFSTSFGNQLTCYKYRAWAPGQPRLTQRRKNCVTLDSERTWKVTTCKAKFAYLCEVHPVSTFRRVTPKNCTEILDKKERIRCRSSQKAMDRDELCSIA